jgi:hypothetical protein
MQKSSTKRPQTGTEELRPSKLTPGGGRLLGRVMKNDELPDSKRARP